MNFENMTDQDVISSLRKNVANERKILHVILEHIREVDSRQLHLKSAYPDLKEFLVEEMGYSGSAANRRIEAALLMKEVPVISEKVRDGVLNLSQIGEVHKAIKAKERQSRCKITLEEKHDLVESVVGKTAYEAQQELAVALDIPVRKIEKIRYQQDGSAIIEICLPKATLEKLLKCKDSTAHIQTQNNLQINLVNTIDRIADEHLNSKNLIRPNKKGNRTDKSNDVTSKTSADSEIPTQHNTVQVPERVNKTLTPKTRALVLQREDCCSFKDPKTGRVCGTRFILQTDHKRSRRLGGNHSLGNLQTLCARHNRFKFEVERNLELQFFG